MCGEALQRMLLVSLVKYQAQWMVSSSRCICNKTNDLHGYYYFETQLIQHYYITGWFCVYFPESSADDTDATRGTPSGAGLKLKRDVTKPGNICCNY